MIGKRKNKKNVVSIVLTGGGTAGHVWPHFALFESLFSPLRQELTEGLLKVHYIGSQTGLERSLVRQNQAHWFYHPIATGKLRRYLSFKNIIDPFFVLWGFLQSLLLLHKLKPNVIFSKGGYVSAPVVWAGYCLGIPIVIHESDATLAFTTKITMPFSQKILLAFDDTQKQVPKKFLKKVVTIGLPLRDSLFGAEREASLKFFNFILDDVRPILLIFGGSLGARAINLAVWSSLPKLLEKYRVIHITGKGHLNLNFSSSDSYWQGEFLGEGMKYAYGSAHMAVCRAGASSIFELAAARIPMLLVPLGTQASRGDQIVNAQIFAANGWAKICFEAEFQKKAVEKIADTLSNQDHLKKALQQAPGAQAALSTALLLYPLVLGGEDRLLPWAISKWQNWLTQAPNEKKDCCLWLRPQDVDGFLKTLASFWRPGDWVFLDGELGVGKTWFVQRTLKHLSSEQMHTPSPTYTLMNQIFLPQNPNQISQVLHLDLYRIKNPEEVCYLGLEDAFDPQKSLVFLEWGQLLESKDWDHFFQSTHCPRPKRKWLIQLFSFEGFAFYKLLC